MSVWFIFFLAGVFLLIFGSGLMVFKSAESGLTKIKLPVVEFEFNGPALFVILIGAGLMFVGANDGRLTPADPAPKPVSAPDPKIEEALSRQREAEAKAASAQEALEKWKKQESDAKAAQSQLQAAARASELANTLAQEKAAAAARAKADADRIQAMNREKQDAESKAASALAAQALAEKQAETARRERKEAEDKLLSAQRQQDLAQKQATEAAEARKAAEDQARRAKEAAIQKENAQFQLSAAFRTRPNRDIFGNDLLNADGTIGFSALDMNACARNCSALAACVAVSFDGWNKRCFPKKTLAESVLDPHSTLAVKNAFEIPSVSKTQADMKIRRNSKFNGAMISQLRSENFDVCRSSCNSDRRCVAFTFLKYETNSENCLFFNQSDDGYFEYANADSGWKQQPR